jgi:hypothetical protein
MLLSSTITVRHCAPDEGHDFRTLLLGEDVRALVPSSHDSDLDPQALHFTNSVFDKR